MKKFFNLIEKILDFFLKINSKIHEDTLNLKRKLNKVTHNMNTTQKFEVLNIDFKPKWNEYNIKMLNISNIKNKEFIKVLWNTLIDLEVWNKYEQKIIMVAFYNPEKDRSLYIVKSCPHFYYSFITIFK